MKKIVINNDNRRFNISSIVVGYLEENKEEVLEFEIPEKYAEYGKKACFSANGQTFAKNFDDVISNKLTITRDISQFKELDMTIAFFKIENEDEIVARTSILHILIENAIVCDDDIKPDEPKIIILDNLIDEVTKLDVLVTKNEKKREEYYQEIQKKVDNGDFNGATFTPSVDTEGNISWTNDKNLPNPTTQNIKGPKGPKGDTYTLTEQDKQDISDMTVESSKSTFNQYYNGKLEDFNNNATSKTNEFNTNADNKIAEYDLHSQELDNKIIDTRNELERVKNDVLETGTDTDTFVHLEDSALAEYQELSVDGVCEQEITSIANGDEYDSPSPDHPQPISTIENSLKITSCNKNLFDGKLELGTYLTTGEKYNATDNYRNTNYISVKPNTTYTFSINGISQKYVIYYYGKDKNFLNYNSLLSTGTFTTPNNTYYINFRCFGSDFTNDFANLKVQLEESPTATEYEQHLETQITANLPEGEFIGKINDTYKDTLKVEYNEQDGQYHLNLYKSIGKFNFTFLQVNQNGIDSNNFHYITPTVENALANYGGKCVSTHCDFNESHGITSSKKLRGYIGLHLLNLSAGATVTEATIKLKELYGNDNVISYYPLETPYVVDLGIVDMPITYNEITNLFTDSDLLPQINAKYYRNFISTVRNLQVNEKALKQELIDINTRLSALETAQTSVASESEVVE